MPEMLSKQAVKACLAGQPTPVVPAWRFWFDVQFWNAHRDEIAQMQQRWTDDFARQDCRLTKRAVECDLPTGKTTDDWGCLFVASEDGVGAHPAEPIVGNLDEWRRYVDQQMPLIETDTFAAGLRDLLAEHRDHYVVGNVWRTFFERMFMIIGFEPLMMEIATDGELFGAMLPVLRDFTIRAIHEVADAGADAVYLADDWGTQHRLMISPEHFARYFKPAYAAMIDAGHQRGLDVWFHSCGDITETIPHWIDIHLDVISNLQTLALDLPAIARQYRGRITFFGGIDVQANIVHGDRNSIRDEIRTLFADFHAHQGKYLASPSNSIMPETPIGNVWAMMEAIDEFGRFDA